MVTSTSLATGMADSPSASHQKLHYVTRHVTDHPIAFKVGTYVVFYYGILMGSAFCVAIATALVHLAQRNDKDTVELYFAAMCNSMFPSAIFGARLFSWVLEDKLNPRLIFRPGFYWHGGLLGVMIGSCLSCLVFEDISMLPLLDAAGLATPAFEILNRIGCFSYGCCWGKVVPASHPHAISYCHPCSCIYRKEEPTRKEWRYPVQLYAAALAFLQLLVLLPFSLHGQNLKLSQGFLFLLSMTLASVARLFCEQYRGDPRGTGTSSTSFFALIQGIMAAAFGGSTWLIPREEESTLTVGAMSDPCSTALENSGVFFCVFLVALVAYGTHRPLPEKAAKDGKKNEN